MDLLSSRMTCRIKRGGENDLKESDKSQIVVRHRVLGQNISEWGGFQSMKGLGTVGDEQPRLDLRQMSIQECKMSLRCPVRGGSTISSPHLGASRL